MTDYTPTVVSLNASKIGSAFAMSPTDIAQALGSTITYYAVNANNTLNSNSTANAPGHWFDNSGNTVVWGANAYVFSELKLGEMSAYIGQYPNRVMPGDEYTITQALVYTKSQSESATVTLIFNIKIKDDVISGFEDKDVLQLDVFPNPTKGLVSWDSEQHWVLFDALGKELTQGNGASLNLSNYSEGLYLLKVGEHLTRLIRD